MNSICMTQHNGPLVCSISDQALQALGAYFHNDNHLSLEHVKVLDEYIVVTISRRCSDSHILAVLLQRFHHVCSKIRAKLSLPNATAMPLWLPCRTRWCYLIDNG